MGGFGIRVVFKMTVVMGMTSLSGNLSEPLPAMLPNVFGSFGHRCDPGDGESTVPGSCLFSHV